MNTFNSYSKQFMWLIAFLLTALVVGCGGGGGGGSGVVGDAPTVTSTTPANNVADVPINRKVIASFTNAMNPATINSTTFTVTAGLLPVAGDVSFDVASNTAIFTPTTPATLPASTLLTATITSGAKDLTGHALASNFVWTFTTLASADTTAPTAMSTNPATADVNVALNNKLTVTFGEAMDPATINGTTFTVINTTLGGTPVAGNVTYAAVGNTATFTPTASLPANSTFTATITNGAKDLAGNALASNLVWTFATGTTPDTSIPTVMSTSPADGTSGVVINRNITATFDKAMDASTITAATVTLSQGTTHVAGTVSYVGTTATFNPTSDLAPSTTYTVRMTTGIKDQAGNALASALVWQFTTGAALATGPAPVILGTAGNFVILAKTGVSTTGTTAVVGNIGLSPAARSFITGFSDTLDSTNVFATSSLVTGKLYAADMAPPTPSNMTTAIHNMETAYTDAAGRTLPNFTELGAGNISGMTLAPGLYKWGSGVLITSGVTLTGSSNDVWIFQIAQNLSVGNGAIVTLSGGAQAKNIFWQVAGQATLGTTSDVKGIILSKTQIVLQTGAVLHGRALAQTAVTLDASHVTTP